MFCDFCEKWPPKEFGFETSKYTNKEVFSEGSDIEVKVFNKFEERADKKIKKLIEKKEKEGNKEIKIEEDWYEEGRLPTFLAEMLPEDIIFDSDCDGYDTCWDNKWQIFVVWEREGEVCWGLKAVYLVFKNFVSCSNKFYGQYDPNAPATLQLNVKIYKLEKD